MTVPQIVTFTAAASLSFKLDGDIRNIALDNFIGLRINISDKSFAQHFGVAMTSLSSDKLKFKQSNVCGERCEVIKHLHLSKQIVLRGWNLIVCSGSLVSKEYRA